MQELARGATTNNQRGGIVFGLLLVVTIATILGGGVVAFTHLTQINPLSPVFFEEAPPLLEWHEVPRGLGPESAVISLSAADNASGLDEVIVRLIQNNIPKEILRRKFGAERILNETIQFKLNSKELELKEGNAELQVLAFDKSLWSNGARISTTVEVNYLKPQIIPLTPQQNGVLGGAEMVFYKVTGKPPDSHGVLAQGSLYNGFAAAGWSDSLSKRGDIYLALYPIPPSFDESKETMRVTARDNLGNSSTAPFNYRIKNRRWASFRTNYTVEGGVRLKDELTNYAKSEKLSIKESGDINTDLRSLIKALTLHDEGFISTALSRTSPKRSWTEAFITPVSATPTNSAGDIRALTIDATEVLRERSNGVRFPVNQRTPVVASNNGTVKFIGTLGCLGNTVVIDHGFGLATIYGHLSDITVQRGVEVKKGSEIAKTGATGLASGEEVYFEVRLHGVSVSPNEWWDQSWVTDHLDNKVNFVVKN
jgi:murein DD-endopeptidase MepM/ murein hydrolase activator NlpD